MPLIRMGAILGDWVVAVTRSAWSFGEWSTVGLWKCLREMAWFFIGDFGACFTSLDWFMGCWRIFICSSSLLLVAWFYTEFSPWWRSNPSKLCTDVMAEESFPRCILFVSIFCSGWRVLLRRQRISKYRCLPTNWQVALLVRFTTQAVLLSVGIVWKGDGRHEEAGWSATGSACWTQTASKPQQGDISWKRYCSDWGEMSWPYEVVFWRKKLEGWKDWRLFYELLIFCRVEHSI